MRPFRSRLAIPAAFVLSASLLAASPEPKAAAASDCGANEGQLCWSNESCANFIFFKMCTTHYKYWEKQTEENEDGII